MTRLKPPATDHAGNLGVNKEMAGTLAQLSDTTVTSLDKIAHFIESFPGYFNQALGEYKKPLTTLLVVLLVIVGIAIANGVLSVINSVPFVPSLLEFVGLGYTGWFIWRYLLYAENRQDLTHDYQALKDRILGKTD